VVKERWFRASTQIARLRDGWKVAGMQPLQVGLKRSSCQRELDQAQNGIF